MVIGPPWFRGGGTPSEVFTHRVGDNGRERLLGIDGVVLEVADEVGGEVHVELPDVARHTLGY
jgi:hypothetical protein